MRDNTHSRIVGVGVLFRVTDACNSLDTVRIRDVMTLGNMDYQQAFEYLRRLSDAGYLRFTRGAHRRKDYVKTTEWGNMYSKLQDTKAILESLNIYKPITTETTQSMRRRYEK